MCETGQVHTGIWWGDLREGDRVEDVGVEGRVILTFIVRAHHAI